MRKFIVMAVANRLYHTCDSKRCMRCGFMDRWYDCMFSPFGLDRLERIEGYLVAFYDRLNNGGVVLLDKRELEL